MRRPSRHGYILVKKAGRRNEATGPPSATSPKRHQSAVKFSTDICRITSSLTSTRLAPHIPQHERHECWRTATRSCWGVRGVYDTCTRHTTVAVDQRRVPTSTRLGLLLDHGPLVDSNGTLQAAPSRSARLCVVLKVRRTLSDASCPSAKGSAATPHASSAEATTGKQHRQLME